MKKKFALQIVAFVLVAGMLSGLYTYTDVFDEVENVIVRVTCLSCLKLDPKTELTFQFETATDEDQPGFVWDNITKGPIFLAFRADVCAACETMEPIVKDIFDVDFGITETFKKVVNYNNMNITFYHINIDHAKGEYREAFELYDKDNVKGVPMFTMITLGYNHGVIEPAYATAYGTLEGLTNSDLSIPINVQRKNILENIIENGMVLYNENKIGFNPK